MDGFTGLLDSPRARQAFLLHLVMDPPWSIWVDDRAPLSVMVMLRGEAWISAPDLPATRVGPAEIAVVRGPEPYRVADPSDQPSQVIALPGGRCTTPAGESLFDALRYGVRKWGNSPTGGTESLVGAYEHVSELGRHLVAALPRLAVVPAAALDSPIIDLLAREIDRDAPGQQVVLDRLLDLLVVAVLRAWFTSADDAPGWFRAHSDPVVGPALRLLQEDPAHPWTIGSLAAAVGCSRATLARRFTALVGEPPMSFLTNRRLALAADLLLEPDATLASVARKVGYANPYALSAAFKRVRGHSPREHRTLSRSGAG
ncbi:MAG TPA: AraC family transcriptional regulator [Natronosporangium sp.]